MLAFRVHNLLIHRKSGQDLGLHTSTPDFRFHNLPAPAHRPWRSGVPLAIIPMPDFRLRNRLQAVLHDRPSPSTTLQSSGTRRGQPILLLIRVIPMIRVQVSRSRPR